MNWLFEQPVVVVLIGIALLIALGGGWSATGRKELLYAMGVTLLLIVAGLIVEKVVVTDREAIRAKLIEIARDLQHNDRSAVVAHVHSSRPELKQKAEAELPKYHFSECRITGIHLIEVNSKAEPRSSIVEFNLMARLSVKDGMIELADASIPRWVKLQMAVEKDGTWKVQEYEHAEPQQMLFDRSAPK
jgi:low affinity Fe/Cu permease